MSVTSLLVKLAFKKGDIKRDSGLVTPDGVIRYDDIRYAGNKKWNVLDVYRPKDRDGEKLPVIISFHGGAWVYGTKETYQYYGMSFAKRGFAFVNFTYRLAPKYKFPAPLEDMNTVCRWVLDNKDRYGFDTDNMFAAGDSAGANGLGLYISMMCDPSYASEMSVSIPDGLKFRAAAFNCGIYRIIRSKRKADINLMKDYITRKIDQKELDKVDVTLHVTEKFPPVYIMTAEGDFLKEYAPLLTKRFDELGVPYEFHMYGSNEVPLYHNFECNMKEEEAVKCNDDECRFFREHMI